MRNVTALGLLVPPLSHAQHRGSDVQHAVVLLGPATHACACTHTCVPQALELLYERCEEVPVLGMYRKEKVASLLVLRDEDMPQYTTR